MLWVFGIHGCLHIILLSIIIFLSHIYFYDYHFSEENHYFQSEIDLVNKESLKVVESPSLYIQVDKNEEKIEHNESRDYVLRYNETRSDGPVKSLLQNTSKSLINDTNYLQKQIKDKEIELLISKGSSVWCWGSSHKDRMCRFSNLCYFPDYDDFVFLHSAESIKFGIPPNQFNPALLDLSSVQDHNQQYFNYVDVPSSAAQYFDVEFISETSLIFKRFNPDNLMHVLHDDILPMYYTLEWMQKNINSSQTFLDAQLVFIEGWNAGNYMALYDLFSKHKPLLLSDLKDNRFITCFKDVYVGLTKSTIWYQYGFSKPQGPISDIMLGAPEIRKFTNFIISRNNFSAIDTYNKSHHYGILLSRKQNRIIINEIDLSIALAREFNMRIFIVGFETHSLSEIIALVSKSLLLIGMHGSLLILSMFLPPDSVFIELYPYGVNPDHYTPYKTLSELPGMNVIYKSWRNSNISNTITHMHRPWETGGISHLSEAEQRHILDSPEVPLHLCCRNPEWLFRIYQDTIVDIFSLLTVVRTAMIERESLTNKDYELLKPDRYFRITPSLVQQILCENQTSHHNIRSIKSPSLKISWVPPWNVEYILSDNIKYEVWLQEQGSDHYTAWILSQTSYHFTTGLKFNSKYFVWIRCILDDIFHGPFNNKQFLCNT